MKNLTQNKNSITIQKPESFIRLTQTQFDCKDLEQEKKILFQN